MTTQKDLFLGHTISLHPCFPTLPWMVLSLSALGPVHELCDTLVTKALIAEGIKLRPTSNIPSSPDTLLPELKGDVLGDKSYLLRSP